MGRDRRTSDRGSSLRSAPTRLHAGTARGIARGRQIPPSARKGGRLMTRDLLRVDDLVVEFPVRGWRKPPFRALNGVSLAVEHGETLGIVGESGSGKSTLGRAVLGLAPITGGTIMYAGRNIADLTRRERRSL